MAKTYDWTPPLGKVNNLTATLQPGGNLAPNTTYYFKVWAIGSSYTTVYGEISDTVSITTDTTNLSVQLNWDAVTDASYYAVVRDTNANFSGFQNQIRGAAGSYYCTINTNGYLTDGTEAMYYPFHGFFIPKEFPGGLDKSLGSGLMMISGGTALDPITCNDVHNAIADTNYSYYDGVNWVALAHVVVNGETYFASEDENIVLKHFYEGTNPSGQVRFGSLNSYGKPENVCTLQFLSHSFVRPIYRYGVFTFYGTIWKDEGGFARAGTVSLFPPQVATDGAVFVDSTLFSAPTANGDFDLSGTIAGIVTSNVDYVKITNINITATGARGYGIDCLASKGSIRNVRLATKVYGVRRSNNSAYEGDEFAFTITNLEVDDADDNIPYVQWYDASNNKGGELWLKSSLDLKVIDSSGAIAGATITATDKDGNQEFSTTTDSDGKISQDLFYVKLVRNDVGPTVRGYGPTYTDYFYKTPHTLTISKPGYQTYTSKLDMSSKKELVIKLEKAVDIVMIDDDLALNTNPKNPRSDFFSKI